MKKKNLWRRLVEMGLIYLILKNAYWSNRFNSLYEPWTCVRTKIWSTKVIMRLTHWCQRDAGVYKWIIHDSPSSCIYINIYIYYTYIIYTHILYICSHLMIGRILTFSLSLEYGRNWKSIWLNSSETELFHYRLCMLQHQL